MSQPGFAYQPLETSQRHLRLLQIYPPSSDTTLDDHLTCSLQNYKHAGCPSYVALSYAWSHDGADAVISINEQEFRISQTIHEALIELRHAYFSQPVRLMLPSQAPIPQENTLTRTQHRAQTPLYVWVDQICINQSDNAEKSDQVLQMRHIYTLAAAAIAWMGPAANDSDALLGLVSSIHEAVRLEDWNALWDLCKDSRRVEILRGAVAAFCSRPYWTRLWVMQEFAMAPELNILCGASLTSAEHMLSVLNVWYTLNDSPKSPTDTTKAQLLSTLDSIFHPATRSFVDSILTRRQRFRSTLWHQSVHTGDPFFQVLSVCLVLEDDYNFPQASDPRDRVFALLHLASDAGHFQTVLDYAKPCEQVYRETAIKLLQQGHVDVMVYSQFPRSLDGLPSWVPDWSMQVRNPCSQYPWAERQSHATGPGTLKANENQRRRLTMMELSDTELQLLGRHVDTVREVGSLWDPDWNAPFDRRDAFDFIQDILKLCYKSQRCREHEELLEALRVATCDGNRYWTQNGPEDLWGTKMTDSLSSYLWAYETTLKEFIPKQPESSHIEVEMEDKGKVEEEEVEDHFNWFVIALHSLFARRPFLTASGYVGLGPEHVQSGDEICLVYGGAVPYIVRPRGTGKVELVGEAYVHGIMYGELLRAEDEDIMYTIV